MSESARQLLEEALALLGEAKTREGIERLERVVVLDPDCAEAWGHLFWHVAPTDRREQGLRCLDEILRLDPGNLEARWRRADQLVRLGRLDEAEAQYRAVFEDHPECHDARTGIRWIDWMRRRGRNPASDEKSQCGLDPAAFEKRREIRTRSLEHFRRRDLRLTTLPQSLEIESSTRCNAACITCNRGRDPYYGEDLAPEIFEQIERTLLPTAWDINLTGYGEPLLARRFDKFHEQACRSGASVYLVTNGMLLTLDRLDRFARHRTDLIVSIDGAKAETFESIRPPARFDRLVESLRLFKKARGLYPEVGSQLGINFVGLRRNIEELPDLVDLAAELGATFVTVLDFIPGVGLPDLGHEHLSSCPDLANQMFDKAAARASKHNINLYLPPKFGGQIVPPGTSLSGRLKRARRFFPERNRFPQRCSDPWNKVLISTSGLVHPCCACRYVMGDLKTQDITTIWNGRRYRWFRRRIRSFFPPSDCRICNQHGGINAGNPMAVRAREGILIKALYLAEKHVRRLAEKIQSVFAPPPPAPRPNYFKGRRIKNGDRLSISPQTDGHVPCQRARNK